MGSSPMDSSYWKVGEWLKPSDCKSLLLRVRGFESLPSNFLYFVNKIIIYIKSTGYNIILTSHIPVDFLFTLMKETKKISLDFLI